MRSGPSSLPCCARGRAARRRIVRGVLSVYSGFYELQRSLARTPSPATKQHCDRRPRAARDLAAADGAGGARAEADDGADGAGAGVGGVDDAEGAEHALGGAAVDGVLARGPGGLGGAAEVLAVVPGGAGVAVDGGRVGDGHGGPGRGEERLEVGDVLELWQGARGGESRGRAGRRLAAVRPCARVRACRRGSGRDRGGEPAEPAGPRLCARAPELAAAAASCGARTMVFC